MEKIVSQLDQDGYFVGPVQADESPLEPGVFLLPGLSIDVPPPDVPAGQRVKWQDEWVFESAPVPGDSGSPTLPPAALSVTRRQAFLALLSTGLLDQVETFIAQESTPRVVKITWETALDFKRDNPLLLAIAQELGLPDSQLDSLFELARTL